MSFIEFVLGVEVEFFWMFSKRVVSLGLDRIWEEKSVMMGYFFILGMVSRAVIVRIVERFSLFCFSNFCFTELVLI